MSIESLKTPAGGCKLVLIALGAVLLGLSAGAFPEERYRNLLEICARSFSFVPMPFCDENPGLHKEYMFLAMTIISLVWALISLVVTLVWRPEFRIIDASIHVLVGILLLIGSILVLQSVIYRYSLVKDCRLVQTSTLGAFFFESSRVAGYCGMEYRYDTCGAILCYFRIIFKYDLTIAAGAIGLLQSLLFFVTAMSAFSSRNASK